MVSQISVSQKEQTRGGGHILTAMEKLRGVAHRHEELLANLRGISQGFQEQIARVQERLQEFKS
jgi:methyl-accepting chemotaxis protein